MALALARTDRTPESESWPNHAASRFVEAGGVRWHVQVAGTGPSTGPRPALLLLHGTGASTHTWRDLLPLLAPHGTVIAPDLPGHGFTGPARAGQRGIPEVSAALAALLRALGLSPVLAVGHSAGAALAVRMALDGHIAPHAVVSLNGAIIPLRGMPVPVFLPAARFVSRLPLLPTLVAGMASDIRSVERLIGETGSRLDAAGIALYARLLRQPAHIAGILDMLAEWDLRPMERDLPHLACPLLLVAARGDRTVPPAEALRVRARAPHATLELLHGLGHLAHEERPGETARLILGALPPAEHRETQTP